MRRPRVRIWMVMIVVAVVGIVSAGVCETRRRRERFWRISLYHRAIAYREGEICPEPNTPLHRWHVRMASKYYDAFRCPWLPVEPDPPAPK
jgi:hypothetical protein